MCSNGKLRVCSQEGVFAYVNRIMSQLLWNIIYTLFTMMDTSRTTHLLMEFCRWFSKEASEIVAEGVYMTTQSMEDARFTKAWALLLHVHHMHGMKAILRGDSAAANSERWRWATLKRTICKKRGETTRNEFCIFSKKWIVLTTDHVHFTSTGCSQFNAITNWSSPIVYWISAIATTMNAINRIHYAVMKQHVVCRHSL